MRRRELLAGAALALAGASLPASAAGTTQPYSRKLYEQYIASGEPFMLDFYAPW